MLPATATCDQLLSGRLERDKNMIASSLAIGVQFLFLHSNFSISYFVSNRVGTRIVDEQLWRSTT